MDNQLPKQVQMQYMRPGQLEDAARKFPVVYVPFGLIEWHGRHLPLGNDALKAHAILVKCADKFGGVVYPPVYFHSDFNIKHIIPLLTELFERLKKTGFRVIIGVSGHNVPDQIDMITKALLPVTADKSVKGVGIWEISLSRGVDSDSDHAAKWETSDMMFFYPELVDMKALPQGPMNLDMEPPWGIGGMDPRKYASFEVGEKNVELAVEAIGKKARNLLNSLPEEERGFGLESLSPENWWMI